MYMDKIEKNEVIQALKAKINSNKKMITKIDINTTWGTQLIFEKAGANFEARREKRKRRKKKFIRAQPHLHREMCPIIVKVTMLYFTHCSEQRHLTIGRCHMCRLKNVNAF